jgi:hypothetical protein
MNITLNWRTYQSSLKAIKGTTIFCGQSVPTVMSLNKMFQVMRWKAGMKKIKLSNRLDLGRLIEAQAILVSNTK